MVFRRLIPPAAFLLVAIAAVGVGAATKPHKGLNAAAERGERIAARDCARCHALDLTSASPRPSAPPFRDIRRRYNEISLAREFSAIGQVGHYEMPPTPITKSDGEDLAAFIEALGN